MRAGVWMQEEEKEAEMGGSGGRATADACELLIHRSGPVMLFSGAEEQKGKCAVSDSDLGKRGGVGEVEAPSPAQCSLCSLLEEACVRSPLQKQQSLPLRPVIPLVARISDQNASGAPPMTVREKTRLEKFRQLLSSHNTDLGEWGTVRVPLGGEGRAEGPCCLHHVCFRLKKITACSCTRWMCAGITVGRW